MRQLSVAEVRNYGNWARACAWGFEADGCCHGLLLMATLEYFGHCCGEKLVVDGQLRMNTDELILFLHLMADIVEDDLETAVEGNLNG